MTVMISVSLAVLGLIFGSFVNALVWRLRQKDLQSNSASPHKRGSSRSKSTASAVLTEPVDEKSSKVDKRPSGSAHNDTEDYSILHGRSMCPDCYHRLAPRDLVPVLSWLSLGGKCRYCRRPISWQYPFIELLTAVFFVVTYLWWPLEFSTYGIIRLGTWLIYIVLFMALSVYDWHWQELPNPLVRTVTGLAVTEAIFVAVSQQNMQLFWWAVFTGLLLFGIFWLIFQVSRGQWIGGGDVKLLLALGIIVGTPLYGLLTVFIASLIGTVLSLPIMILKYRSIKASQVIPFGPALMLATYLVFFLGTSIIAWLQGLLIY